MPPRSPAKRPRSSDADAAAGEAPELEQLSLPISVPRAEPPPAPPLPPDVARVRQTMREIEEALRRDRERPSPP